LTHILALQDVEVTGVLHDSAATTLTLHAQVAAPAVACHPAASGPRTSINIIAAQCAICPGLASAPFCF
jgi:hypothetical protein